jgi:hypothetical protein
MCCNDRLLGGLTWPCMERCKYNAITAPMYTVYSIVHNIDTTTCYQAHRPSRVIFQSATTIYPYQPPPEDHFLTAVEKDVHSSQNARYRAILGALLFADGKSAIAVILIGHSRRGGGSDSPCLSQNVISSFHSSNCRSLLTVPHCLPAEHLRLRQTGCASSPDFLGSSLDVLFQRVRPLHIAACFGAAFK